MAVEEKAFMNREMTRVPSFAYEESAVSLGALAGTCIIWEDIGAQLGEKGLRVLAGEDPGAIPWDYPRTYNVMVNLAAARRFGIAIPAKVLEAASRVFTDFDGNYVGKK